MGRLDCEPDELFEPKVFGTRDLTCNLPLYIRWLLSPLTGMLQSLADSFGLDNLLAITFIARPIQVRSKPPRACPRNLDAFQITTDKLYRLCNTSS